MKSTLRVRKHRKLKEYLSNDENDEPDKQSDESMDVDSAGRL